MAAYWIARSHVTDAVVYKKYTDQVPAIVSKHGGRILARGGRYQIMAGPQTFERYVVIEFPTLEQGVACFQSPDVPASLGPPHCRRHRRNSCRGRHLVLGLWFLGLSPPMVPDCPAALLRCFTDAGPGTVDSLDGPRTTYPGRRTS